MTSGKCKPDLSKAALIVVDVQNDFLPGGALAVPEGDEVIAPVNRLMASFDVVVLTADWHPATHVSFAASHPGRRQFETIELSYGTQVLWPAHCVAGTAGAQFAAALAADAACLILRKGTHAGRDSYSGFREAGKGASTGLAGWLRERGIEDVYVCGLALDYCVNATALDAADAGFRTAIVVDACRAIDSGAENMRALQALWDEAGIDCATVDDLAAGC